MAAPDLAAADPVAVLLQWLKNHPRVTDLLGGPEHVSGLAEAPWPHLMLTEGPGGDLRGAQWDAEFEVDFELHGAPDGTPGKAALRATAVRLMQMLCDLPQSTDFAVTEPVVSNVRPSGVFLWNPTTVGSPRYTFGVLAVLHPPFEPPAP